MSLIRGDAVNLPLADETVDLIVTSPPYFALRSYQDAGEHYDGQIGSEDTPQAFLEALWAVTAECRRVLKRSGSMFVNLGDKYAGSNAQSGGPSQLKSASSGRPRGDLGPLRGGYVPKSDVPTKSLMGLPWRYAIGCIDDLDLILRAEIVWSKPNGLPESVTDRVRRSHEQWFMFTREPRYYSAVDEVREPQTWTPSPGYQGHARASRGGGPEHTFSSLSNPLGKLPGSVWTIPSEPLKVPDWLGVDHFAAFPQEWPRRLILGWSPPGGVVLDPFGGTGTVAMVARALGRYPVHLDLSSDYLRLARWRVYESGHASKTTERTNRERQGTLL